jgi:hypothetical protein
MEKRYQPAVKAQPGCQYEPAENAKGIADYGNTACQDIECVFRTHGSQFVQPHTVIKTNS